MSNDRFKRWAQQRRDDCPSSDALEAYRTESLTATEQTELATHLRACAHCTNRLIDLREFAALDTSEPAPASLLKRVRATTQNYTRVAQTPAQSSAPAGSRWSRLLADFVSRWQAPAFATGFAAVALTLAVVLLTNNQPGPLLNPDLIPRGAAVDEAALSRSLGAVSAQGVAVDSMDGPARLHLASQAQRGALLTLDPDAGEPRFTPRATTASDVGQPVLLVGTDHTVVVATITRVGRAAWQGAAGVSHEGELIALQAAASQPPVTAGSAVLDLNLQLLGIVAVVGPDDTGTLAVPVLPGNGL